MSSTSFETGSDRASLEAHLLGRIEFGQCLELQRRLVDAAAARADGRIDLLICEHPQIITIGRGGSPDDVRLDAKPLQTGQLEVRWVKRGGGCMVHVPGQLAIYPIVDLGWHDFSIGEYLDRFQAGLLEALDELGFSGTIAAHRHGIWGRTGQLAAFGVAVRNSISSHGAFLNVAPAMGLFRLVDTDPEEMTQMSCLMAERRQPVKMTSVRAELVRRLADAFGCNRYHLHTGHPWLRRKRGNDSRSSN
jgi:lipoyl(octanoyl) transferase